MTNTRYTKALDRLIGNFKNDFIEFSREQYTTDAGTLMHAGEMGASREKRCKDFLSNVLPRNRKIETRGFVINAQNETSKEQDLIIFSEADTPLLTVETDKFFPIETVVGIGQVKSILRTRANLKEALDNLVSVKRMRENMGHTSVAHRSQPWSGDNFYPENAFDQVFTFLICEKIAFEINAEEIDALYNEVPQRLKHNLLCSLENGVFGYIGKPGGPLIGVPQSTKADMRPTFVPANDKEIHIKIFLANLGVNIPNATVFSVDMGVYLK